MESSRGIVKSSGPRKMGMTRIASLETAFNGIFALPDERERNGDILPVLRWDCKGRNRGI